MEELKEVVGKFQIDNQKAGEETINTDDSANSDQYTDEEDDYDQEDFEKIEENEEETQQGLK